MIGKTRHLEEPARGVLVPHFEHGRFEHKRIAPSAALAALVEHYWFVGWDMQGRPPKIQETLPHPNVHLVIEEHADGIYGVHTARYTRLLDGKSFAFGIKFRPGGFQPFLNGPVSAIADQRVSIAEVFGSGGDAFASQLRSCDGADAMATLAEAFLAPRLPEAAPQVDLACALMASIESDASLTSVEALALKSGLNKRALQRLFQHYVGVGPKWVIKRYRMHEAVAQLQSGAPVRLAQLAQDLGYFDQSHFIREFTRLIGKPPGEYARQVSGQLTKDSAS